MNNQSMIDGFFEYLETLHSVEPQDIPEIDLYMDQVTTFMEKHLNEYKRFPDEKILTKTMINNYVKSHLIPAPIKKKYSKEHMILFLFVYYMKDFMSIGDIEEALHPIIEQCFGKEDSSISLEDIYRLVLDEQKHRMEEITGQLKQKAESASHAFRNVSDDEAEALERFSLICSLGFDIYLRKRMIAWILDHSSDSEPV